MIYLALYFVDRLPGIGTPGQRSAVFVRSYHLSRHQVEQRLGANSFATRISSPV
jgi:hypothetical protein